MRRYVHLIMLSLRHFFFSLIICCSYLLHFFFGEFLTAREKLKQKYVCCNYTPPPPRKIHRKWQSPKIVCNQRQRGSQQGVNGQVLSARFGEGKFAENMVR